MKLKWVLNLEPYKSFIFDKKVFTKLGTNFDNFAWKKYWMNWSNRGFMLKKAQYSALIFPTTINEQI